MENDALFMNNQERRNTGNRKKKTSLVQFSNAGKQQITNNNSNRTNNITQRLAADQLAMRTRLQRDSSLSEAVPSRSTRSKSKDDSTRSKMIRRDVTWQSLEISGSQLLIEISRN
ncbi:hypothetical protein AVEN_150099-1 [Araneus ventricosus]|uniref:Uncharacterized protein n=1 Tax=Araneus ventricosus TaxID=182803 RepID=A0A4Y2DE45_ARAVE|nr:hypothetical protein AVEN_150099-1 [Araneus ventricosus]